MKLPSKTEMRILETIGSNELNGPDIRERYRSKFGEEIQSETLYVVLFRLKKAGWIDSRKATNTEDGRFRDYFLTGPGSKAMAAARDAHAAVAIFGQFVPAPAT